MRALFALLLLVAAPAILAACHDTHPAGTVAQKYTCPMHPQYITDKPGNCPICGMTLVPVGSHDGSAAPASTSPSGFTTVNIDPERRRLIGLKTTAVRRADLAGSMRTVGRVAFDETRIAKVQPRFSGFIERLEANFTGKFVRKGQRLASIYSPELLSTEEELLLAVQGRDALKASGLLGAEKGARARLRLLGVTDRQINQIVRTGVPLRTLDVVAPISGFITTKNAVAGARVSMEQPLFEIVDLSTVWVLADVYESELPRVAVGQRATATLSYWPGRSWSGKVTYLYPTVDDKTRTVKVRVALPNPKNDLRPEMFADVVIQGAARSALVVPEDAIIDTGTRKVAFVDLGGGRLQPREVEVGQHSEGMYEIRSGLSEGEQVALGASFLLDSESRLKAAVGAMGQMVHP